MQTLVLDSGYQPVKTISWKRAIALLIGEKADIISAYDKVIRSVSQTFQLPKVIRLKNFINKITVVNYSRRNVFARDDFKCQYCGTAVTQKTATIDHVIPKSKGGKNGWTNTVTCCHKCNNKKDDKTLAQVGMKLLNRPIRPKLSSIVDEEFKKVLRDIFD